MNKNEDTRNLLTENWVYFTTKIRNGKIDITSMIPNYKRTWSYFSEVVGSGSFSVDDIKLINAIHRFTSELTEAARYFYYINPHHEVSSNLLIMSMLIYKLLDNIADKRFSTGVLRFEIFGKKNIVFLDGFDHTFRDLWKECFERLKQGQEDFL
ncbi:MAG: hypothetical protein IKO44_04820 [Ruminococcus sp.]|nr:hypothetical protein [Ruminococcus sp.]MBR4622844.1 hypothetical protein [Ruminococcus sp.]